MAKQTEGATGGVQSLHRALSILQTVADHRSGIGLPELCASVGLHRSTTFHLAKTMVALGLLRQDPDDKRYRIGSRLFSLASGALDEIQLCELAAPILEDLADEIGETTHLAVWTRMGSEVAIIERCEAPSTIRLTERVGATRPAHATAIGKVLLSGLSADRLKEAVEAMPLEPVTRRTITGRTQLFDEIGTVQDQGYAFDDGEFDIDVRCLAAPVVDFRGNVIAAVGFSSPVWRFDDKQIDALSEMVKVAAAKVASRLGAPDD